MRPDFHCGYDHREIFGRVIDEICCIVPCQCIGKERTSWKKETNFPLADYILQSRVLTAPTTRVLLAGMKALVAVESRWMAGVLKTLFKVEKEGKFQIMVTNDLYYLKSTNTSIHPTTNDWPLFLPLFLVRLSMGEGLQLRSRPTWPLNQGCHRCQLRVQTDKRDTHSSFLTNPTEERERERPPQPIGFLSSFSESWKWNFWIRHPPIDYFIC